MAKLYVFGIGGTGARVLRSFTMLMAAGVNIGVDEIVPIVIDPDASNADLTRTVTLMNNYRSIRSSLSFSDSNESIFFRKELSQILVNYTLCVKDTDDKTFQQFIDLPSMDKTSQAMMRMFFSEKNLASSMNVGFKGNPNVGSVVLNQIVDSEDFQTFANNFDSGDKIFIISSIFGGTGASGFPLLLKTLRTGTNFPNHDIINHAEIGAISILPYFKLDKDEQSEIDSSTFISKTKSALAYYENNIIKNNSIDALYFLADDVANTYENHEGGIAQQNDAHLIEFLAATAIVDFSNKQHQNTTNKELGLKDLVDSVTFDSFYDNQNRLLYAPLTEFLMMANCLDHKFDYYSSKSFNANNDNFRELYSSSFMSDLRNFVILFIDWLAEMKNNKRSLDLFNLNANDKPFDIVTGRKSKKIISLKSDYDLVTDRLNTAVKKCQSKEDKDKFLEMFYIAMTRLFNEKINS
ncbi:MAG: hypothetical protein IKQ72_01040 [Bacteroidaceae bacterium]|nr:hypothetical protein [Bacteroidaceae bacterium]